MTIRDRVPSFLAMTLIALWLTPARGAQFPAGPDSDSFESRGVFRVTLSPALGGQTLVISVRDVLPTKTVVFRSASFTDAGAGGETSTVLGEDTIECPGGTTPATSSAQIGFHPDGFQAGIREEVHTEIACMNMTGGGWTVRAGRRAPTRPRSLGDVESRDNNDNQGFPADSFFNLYLEIESPPGPPFGGRILFNVVPILVQDRISGFPPNGANYLHSFVIAGRVPLFFIDQGGVVKFAGWLAQGTHNVGVLACLRKGPTDFFTVFSVDGPANGAEGLFQPDKLFPFGHPTPNDVYALGPAGPNNRPIEGELFQSSAFAAGAAPDATNVERLSAVLGMPPGPFAPNIGGALPPAPAPLGGTFGLKPGDNIDALSFGRDGGNVFVFSVAPNAQGVDGTAVRFQWGASPQLRAIGGAVPSNGGGDPGREAAGDLFVSSKLAAFGFDNQTRGLTAAAANSNGMLVDEFELGLQAPANRHRKLPMPLLEDDVDAIELSNAVLVDANADGVPGDNQAQAYAPVFFSLHKQPNSPSLGIADPCSAPGAGDPDGVTADDILVSPPPVCVGASKFAIYARGKEEIGLRDLDDLDALVLSDRGLVLDAPDGKLTPLRDSILFSLAVGSPSLTGVNANFPAGAHAPGTVFKKTFGMAGITVYASAAELGLRGGLNDDELDALDIGWGGCEDCAQCGGNSDFDTICDFEDVCPFLTDPEQTDCDGDGVGDACEVCDGDYNPPEDCDHNPGTPNQQCDSDNDGTPDACDPTPGTVPENDLCARAITVPDGSTAFTTTGAGTDGPPHAACDDTGSGQPPPDCSAANEDCVHQDIWFRYVASCTGIVTVSLCNSTFDTKLAVYNGTSCDLSDSTLEACNDDSCGSQSKLIFPATVRTGYTIRVGGSGGSAGAGTITIACVADAPKCVNAVTPMEEEFPCTFPDLNGGCYVASQPSESISCEANVVSGWSGNNGVVPDVDTYEFVQLDTAQVTFDVSSEFDSVVQLLGDACPPAVIATAYGTACAPASVTACLEGGESYRLLVMPLAASPAVDCLAEYTVSMNCGSTCTINPSVACSTSVDTCYAGQNNTKGCNEPACCGYVCSFDPYCCDVNWDTLCAEEAADVCDCSDGNACTNDALSLATGCGHTPVNCSDGNLCTQDSCSPAVGCTHPPTDCNDNIPCTVDTCTPGSGCNNAPGTTPVGNTVVATSRTQFAWVGESAGPFNVYRGSIPASYNHTCFAPGVLTTNTSDPSSPAVGTRFYYLVSRDNQCGESGLGNGTPGPRPNNSPCP